MKQLLIATHNPAKKQELGRGFGSLISRQLKLLFLDDLHISSDMEETGKTFEENARLKARYFAHLSRLATVADDGGIEIDVLQGEPGIHSKRWLGREAADTELIAHTLKKLNNVPPVMRTAQFTVCLAYYNPATGFQMVKTESVRGRIALSPSKHACKGFPYRALFIVDTYNKYYDELTEQEHNFVNHRLKAVHKLIPFIKGDLLQ
ncbi:MAG: non-canonical purine NTP pyrophosphatase [bacterium]